jgi:hypothetical protein
VYCCVNHYISHRRLFFAGFLVAVFVWIRLSEFCELLCEDELVCLPIKGWRCLPINRLLCLPNKGLEPSTSRLEVLRSIQLSQLGQVFLLYYVYISFSDTGTRTLANGVKARYPNHLDNIGRVLLVPFLKTTIFMLLLFGTI